jgi:N-methylhydantoinase B
VLHDVAEGWVTPERARDVYGVVVNPDGTLDTAATERLRG